jgi:phosphoenolpyruvate carboxylase
MPDELRADVRMLGELLGRVIAEDGGPDLLADVERLRKAVIAARRREISVDEVAAMVAEWPIDRSVQIARAFTCYFHLVNLAEEHFRIRTLRSRDTGEGALPESLAQAVGELKHDLRPEELARLISDLEFRPVLTAHPTEARRRAIVAAIQRISAQLAEYNTPGRGANERQEAHRRLLEEIDLLWRTAQLRHTKLDPLDEVRTAMSAFDETLFRTVPRIYRSLDAALAEGTGTREPQAKAFIRYGSWIGGDRDGNPNVTARVTREAVLIQAEHVLIALENAAIRIGRTLTASSLYGAPSKQLREALASAADDHPELVSDLGKRSPREPHRQWLLFVAATWTWRTARPMSCCGTCVSVRRPWCPRGRRARRTARSSTLSGRSRPSGSTSPSWRSASIPRCTPRRWRRSGPARRPSAPRKSSPPSG